MDSEESRASSGPEEQVQSRDDHADVGHGGANLNSDRRSMGTNHHQVTVISPQAIAAECALRRKGFEYCRDLTESIKEETVFHHQSSIDQTCV